MIEVLKLDDVCLSYGKEVILDGVNLSIAKGDFIGIIGANGSGKTTLMKAILGILKPVKGQIIRNYKNVGYLPQKVISSDPLFPASVREIIKTGSRKKKDMRLKALAHQLGITGILDKRIGDLSGGQQQRVLLARALLNDPEMLILDEPTSALDPQSRKELFEMLKHLNKGHQMTILLVSHDLYTLTKYVENMMYIDRRVAFVGSVNEFYQKFPQGVVNDI